MITGPRPRDQALGLPEGPSYQRAEPCLKDYYALGGSGGYPDSCVGLSFLVPLWGASHLAGWPRDFVDLAHRHDSRVFAFGVDSLADWLKLQYARLDGIISSRIEVVVPGWLAYELENLSGTLPRELATLAASLIWLAMALGLPPLMASPGFRLLGDPDSLATKVLGQLVLWILTVGTLLMVVKWQNQPLSTIGLEIPDWRSVLWGLAVAVAIITLVSPFAMWVLAKSGLPGLEAGLSKSWPSRSPIGSSPS